MRSILSVFVLIFCSLQLWAQIVVTSESFPRVGDTLTTAIDNLPSNIDLGEAGPEQSWNFTSLQAPFIRQSIILPAAEGDAADAFPGANIFTTIDLGQGDLGEAYYLSKTNSFDLLGYFGADPAGLGVELLVQFSPVIAERHAPLEYGDVHNLSSMTTLPFAAEDLPQEVLDSLPIRPDSLRLRITLERTDEVDAWGNVTIPGKGPGESYEVLREKRVEVRDLRLDVKISFLPWQDITDILPPELDRFKTDTVTSFHFFNDEAKEPIAIVTVDQAGTGFSSVEFKANDFTSPVKNISNSRPNVFAYPNPAIDDVRFEFTGIKSGNYSLKVFNILGVEVWRADYYLNGSKTVKSDISNLKKGTYLYSLVDDKGKSIATKRLMIIRP